jgi:hypothetical protein
MKGVNSESSNTDKMRQHQMTKAKVQGDSLRHEDVDLMVCTDVIDKAQTVALNALAEQAALLDILQANPEDKALASDVDPQLLLKVAFKEKVNLSSVVLRFNAPPAPGEDEEETYAKPRCIKIFVNMRDLDFSDVEEASASAQHVVEAADAVEAKISCAGHKFQRLETLQILVEEAADPEATRTFINRVSIVGHQAESYHAQYK